MTPLVWTRRQLAINAARLTGVAALTGGVAGCIHRAPAQISAPLGGGYRELNSLKAHAAARGFLYGCAVDTGLLERNAAYASLIREQANIVVAENVMKWAPMRPTIDSFNFKDADLLVAFAEKNGMKVRGHNLCWHRQLPRWFASEATSTNARQLLTTHIQTVAGRYAGRMHSWDVVNEAVSVTDGRGDGLRESPWLKLVGEEYIELAFRTARDADPQALLTYNDYGVEGEDEASARKRSAVLTLLRRLKARHVPLDALGVQSHVTAGRSFGAGLRNFLASARELNLQIFLTEMDVNDRNIGADVSVRDTAVAATYGDYLRLTLSDPGVRVVLTWGITNAHTWLNSEDTRPDHLPERCLPFDHENAPTASFFAMRDAFDQRRPVQGS